jgi:hypothetical protein
MPNASFNLGRRREDCTMGVVAGGVGGLGFGGFTSTGAILVLFILLVIISRAILI